MSGLNNVSDIPKQWRDLFTSLRGYFPSIIMAGGCLRDRDMGVKVNDIDLFLQETTGKWDDLTAVERALIDMGAQHAEIMSNKCYPAGVDNHIVGVVEAKFISCPHKIQIVVGDWGVGVPNLFNRFDFGICKIAYDGREIYRHRSYAPEARLKLFSIGSPRSPRALTQSVERYARLKKKYPDWKFDIGSALGWTGGWVSVEYEHGQVMMGG